MKQQIIRLWYYRGQLKWYRNPQRALLLLLDADGDYQGAHKCPVEKVPFPALLFHYLNTSRRDEEIVILRPQ